MTLTTRFAPSPTGPLHLGHAYSALCAQDLARAAGGTFLLRIEDIDQSRARPAWEAQIYDDLGWLGLTWQKPVMRQSARMAVYRQALDTLWARGALYPCTCNRRDIAEATAAPQEGAPMLGPDGVVYPGTCRPAHPGALAGLPRPQDVALRLDLRAVPDAAFSFTETGAGPAGETGEIRFTRTDLVQGVGDVVLARRDMGTSYHLSVVLDDAAQRVTDVVRGCDLFDATRIHVALQELLGISSPRYHHHRLIRDDAGKRLAKRDDARAIATFRAEGATPADIRRIVGLTSAAA